MPEIIMICVARMPKSVVKSNRHNFFSKLYYIYEFSLQNLYLLENNKIIKIKECYSKFKIINNPRNFCLKLRTPNLPVFKNITYICIHICIHICVCKELEREF